MLFQGEFEGRSGLRPLVILACQPSGDEELGCGGLSTDFCSNRPGSAFASRSLGPLQGRGEAAFDVLCCGPGWGSLEGVLALNKALQLTQGLADGSQKEGGGDVLKFGARPGLVPSAGE